MCLSLNCHQLQVYTKCTYLNCVFSKYSQQTCSILFIISKGPKREDACTDVLPSTSKGEDAGTDVLPSTSKREDACVGMLLSKHVYTLICRTNTDVVFVGVKRKRCGEYAGCTSPECGSCRFCLDMTKFGGPGKKKKPCYQWKCSKMQIRQSTETRIAKQLRQTTTSKLKVTKTPLGEIQNQNHGKNKS